MATREGLRSMTQQAQDMGEYDVEEDFDPHPCTIDEEEFPYEDDEEECGSGCFLHGDPDCYCDQYDDDEVCASHRDPNCTCDLDDPFEDEQEPEYEEPDYPDYGPPGSGAVITEYDGWEEESW